MPAPANPELVPWEDVADRIGLSRSQTQRIGEQALDKLRKVLSGTGLTPAWLYREFGISTRTEEQFLAIILTNLAERRTVTLE